MKKTLGIWVAMTLLIFGVQVAAAETISTAREQQIIRNILSIYEPDHPLLQASDTQEIRKCGFGIMAEARLLWSRLSPESRELLKSYVQDRPERQVYYDTPDGHFRIHYDTTGKDSVDMRHGVDTDGVPMYVKRVADIFHEVWEREVTDMGYPGPPADDFYPEGSSAAYDIYLTDLSKLFYGLTHGDEIFQDGTSDIWRMTSFIELDNDYQGYSLYGPDEWEAILAVTVAHEFFHAVQYGIDALEFLESEDDTSVDFWWHEMSSTWMEDIVYDDVNDYYYYLPGFFNHPDWALNTQRKSNYEYGACVWPRYLTERFGNDIMYDIWMQCGEKSWLNTIEAWVDQIEAYGSTLPEELGRFRLWCYFSGDRYRSFAFSEGEQYPTFSDTIFVARHMEYPVQDTISNLIAPGYMGASYLEFMRPVLNDVKDFKVQFNYDEREQWIVAAAGLIDYSDPEVFIQESIFIPMVVENWQQYESIMVLPIPYDEDYSKRNSIGTRAVSYMVSDTLQVSDSDSILTIRPNPYIVGEGELLVIVNRYSKDETEVFFYNAAGEFIRGGRNEISADGDPTPFYAAQGEEDISETFYWDGRNAAGEKVASGVYLCLVRLGNQTSLQKIAVFRQ